MGHHPRSGDYAQANDRHRAALRAPTALSALAHPDGAFGVHGEVLENCGRTSEPIGSKTVWRVAQGPYPTHRGPSRAADRVWGERHYRTVARTDRLKSGRPPHSALSVGILKFIFTLKERSGKGGMP